MTSDLIYEGMTMDLSFDNLRKYDYTQEPKRVIRIYNLELVALEDGNQGALVEAGVISDAESVMEMRLIGSQHAGTRLQVITIEDIYPPLESDDNGETDDPQVQRDGLEKDAG